MKNHKTTTTIEPRSTSREEAGPSVVGAVAPGGAHAAPRPTVPRALPESRLAWHADAAYGSVKTTAAVDELCQDVVTVPSRNRLPSAAIGGDGPDKDGATMGNEQVRDADANTNGRKRSGGPAGPPKRILSNREIADGLFAVLGDFYALEREAFKREYDARSRGADAVAGSEPGDGGDGGNPPAEGRSDVRRQGGTAR